MSRIRSIEEKEATDIQSKVFNGAKEKFGVVPNLLKSIALWPEYAQLIAKEFQLLFFSETHIDRVTKEMIFLLVARLNQSQYNYAWHSLFLRQLGVSPNILEAFSHDYRKAPIDDRQKAILAFADKITKAPFSISDREVNRLKEIGLSDEEILEIGVLASFCNSLDRLTLALDVQFET